jgi:hypothetical protein
MSTAKSVLVAAVLALVCGGALAADEGKDRRGFNEMDKNSDGKLTRDEAAGNKALLAKWKEADSNNDGVLTRGEYLSVALAEDWNTAKEKVSGWFGGGASTGSTAEPKSASTGSSAEGKSASTGSTSESKSK